MTEGSKYPKNYRLTSFIRQNILVHKVCYASNKCFRNVTHTFDYFKSCLANSRNDRWDFCQIIKSTFDSTEYEN